MSEENKTTEPQVKVDNRVLLGVPVAEIPQAPWTFAALGHDRYWALATYAGYVSPSDMQGYRPDLDPRSFARGIAWKRINSLFSISATLPLNERMQLISDILERRLAGDALLPYLEASVIAEVEKVLFEAEALHDYMQSFLPAAQGTALNIKAVAAREARTAKQR